jgi:hypothetical protein
MKASKSLLTNAAVLALFGILAGAIAGLGVGILTKRAPASSSTSQ